MAKIEENIIQNAMPAESKEQGLAVLGTIVTNQAMVFAEKMLPTLEKEIKKTTDKCPLEVEKLINIRNNIVGQANSIIEIINKVSVTVVIASTGINTLVKLIKVLKIAKSSLSLGSKFAPIVPGAVASGISDLDDVVTNITFDTQGNAKLPPILSAINSIAIPIALISFYIAKFLSLISMLDVLIGDCINNEGGNTSDNPNLVLSPISEDLVEIAETQNQAEESPNSSLYQGFILEIEKVPYSPTVDRIRAIGKNQDGIILIQTELSFTPIGQVMINELKFIIDRDDLKAY